MENNKTNFYKVKVLQDIQVKYEGQKVLTLLKDSEWVVEEKKGTFKLAQSDFILPDHMIQVIEELDQSGLHDNLEQIIKLTTLHIDNGIPLFSDEALSNQIGIIHKTGEYYVLDETETYYRIYLGNQFTYLPKEIDSIQSKVNDAIGQDEKKEESANTLDSRVEFTEHDQFFKVVQSNVSVYDNSSGKLIQVGMLEKDQIYPIGKFVGNWIEIQFGNKKGYVWKEATEPTTSKPKKLGDSRLNSKRELIAKQNLPVYDNSTGKLIQFGKLKEGIRYPIIRETGNWAEIVFAGRNGYVYKTGYKFDFTSESKYFKVNQSNVSVYDNSTGKLIQVGMLEKDQIYPIGKIVGNWIEIQFGNKKGYVWKDATEPTTKKPNKLGNSNLITEITVKSTQTLPIFDNSTGKLIQIGTLKEGIEYQVIKQTGNWIEILFAERIGYVYVTGIELTFSKGILYFEVIQDNVQIFQNKNGRLIKFGNLVKGQQYKRIRDYGNWHEVRIGNQTGYVWKEATKPLISPSYKNKFTGSTESENYVELISRATVYDNTGGDLVPFAHLEQGMTAPFYEKMGNWYKVSAFGRVGYVYAPAVKAHITDIVNPYQTYTYEQMQKDIYKLQNTYPDLIKVENIGRSVDGRNIYAVKLGKGNVKITINAAHHAREHLTTNLVMEMIDTYAQAYVKGTSIDGYNAKNILDKTSIWFIPMVNPDGVTLVQKGHLSAKNPFHVLKLNGYSTDFRAWKANIMGVDLNRQYPADWKNIKYAASRPGPQNYKGKKPLTEPEVRALYNFTLKHDFKTAVAYHSSGEILYWNFHQDPVRYKRDHNIAEMIERKTGYRLVYPGPNPSGGGYTDWFIISQKKPGFTPEISPYVGPRPVPISNFSRIWKQNDSIGLMLADEAYKNRNNR